MAGEATDQINNLKKQIEELDQKVKVLSRNRELDHETAAEKSKQTPRVSLGGSGFSVTSSDSNFVFKVRGSVQADARFYPSERVDNTVVFADPNKTAREAFSVGAGVNWHLNRNVKLSLDYEHTDFSATKGSVFNGKDEHIIFTRAQVSF